MISKGFKIIEVSGDDKFLDVDIEKAEQDSNAIFLRAHDKGEPVKINYELNGVTYPAVQVLDKIYIPDKTVKAGGAV